MFRRVPRTAYPPSPVRLNLLHGLRPIWALVPGWGKPIMYGSSGLEAGFVRSVGIKPMTFLAQKDGADTSTGGIVAGRWGHIGTARALQLNPVAESSQVCLLRNDADAGIPFSDANHLTVAAIFRPNGTGQVSTGDPRIFSKDVGNLADDHDLMIGTVSSAGMKGRCRIRIGTATLTLVTGSTTVQNDAVNLVAGGMQGVNNGFVQLIREDGQAERFTDTATGSYNPRTTTVIAVGSNAGIADNAFKGDVLLVAAFDITLTEDDLRRWFANPWQIFEPAREPVALYDPAAPVYGVRPKPQQKGRILLVEEAQSESNGDPATSLSSGTFDSTQYTQLICFVKHEGAAATITITDTQNNRWEVATAYASAAADDTHGQLFKCELQGKSTVHNVTASFGASRTFRAICVIGVKCDGKLELIDSGIVENGNGTVSDPGVLANPGGYEHVCFHGVAEYGGPTYTVTPGWTEIFPLGSGGTSTHVEFRVRSTLPLEPTAFTWDTTQEFAAVAAMWRAVKQPRRLEFFGAETQQAGVIPRIKSPYQ